MIGIILGIVVAHEFSWPVTKVITAAENQPTVGYSHNAVCGVSIFSLIALALTLQHGSQFTLVIIVNFSPRFCYSTQEHYRKLTYNCRFNMAEAFLSVK
ncbi:hypothetical protein [Adhaeribacter rhizoryzae]|uniref:Uncharacterized protein n=1 Tax=Adhaeribacter rhizoryzae TaxID=2607907 RepID=A0A5M6D4H5_9BACT|nr:hypothetical protein [Adhaeribacter rhizoryzae]KAA5542417.1 hypothetical protein F0145_18375 [Adhaeribacter rhizoryzae]